MHGRLSIRSVRPWKHICSANVLSKTSPIEPHRASVWIALSPPIGRFWRLISKRTTSLYGRRSWHRGHHRNLRRACPHGVAPSPPQDARLHIFRLRAASALQPDLRHVSVALDLSPQEKDDLLEASSSAYDTLSYAVPVDRLSWPLSSSVRRALTVHATESAQAVGSTQTSPVHPSALPASDVVPFLRQEDVKPPQKVLELCFAAYTRAVGEQVPGLDTEVVAQRIRDGSISALLANAMCAIGTSLYERAGERLPVAEALGSKVYLRRSRA